MTKKDALNIVFSCAISYKENLAGRSLLFVTADKHKVVRGLEVTFDSSNFLHMTGFKLSNKEIGANNFLSMCYMETLNSAFPAFLEMHENTKRRLQAVGSSLPASIGF